MSEAFFERVAMMRICENYISGPMAWTASTIVDQEGLVKLDDNCLDEIKRVADRLEANPLPDVALKCEYFDMRSCKALMKGIREQLDTGIGFAVIDRLPIDDLDYEVAKKLYWLLMSIVGQPVAQKWDGTLLYDVIDDGGKDIAGSNVRSSKTNGDQGYHVDNAFNLPPDIVSLLCIQTAKEGGTSGIISFETVHNLLLKEYPDILKRLYEPFYFDRQMEHAPGEVSTISKPIFEADGDAIQVNYSPNVIYRGYEMVDNDAMDDATHAALEAIKEVCERPEVGKNLEFEPGQIQILNNRCIGHRRTGYIDWPEPERRRHLVRMWIRDQGLPFYHG